MKDYAEKIAKLLAKAESTTPEEAEALTAKAQEWMTRYAIDEAMVAKARGTEAPEKIVEEKLCFVGLWSRAHFTIAGSITDANDVRTLMSRGGWVKDKVVVDYRENPGARYKNDVFKLHLIGFEGDVKRVKMLNASLQIQAQAALNIYVKENRDAMSWMSSNQKHIEKRQFLIGFARGVERQLATARATAVQEAEVELEAAAAGESAGPSVALVLREKKDRVNDWMDETYGKLRKSTARYQSGSSTAHSQGVRAGMSADAGGRGKVAGGTAGALTR